MPDTIAFKLNGKPVTVEADPTRTLLWVLRTDLALTGTKFGCAAGHCGACTILINGAPARSCLLKLSNVANKEVVTIEGLAQDGKLHPLQSAFIEHDALQCGFCTPGMIMTGVALLNRNPKPTTEQIMRGLESNLCRCGAHVRIVRAMQTASAELSRAKPAGVSN